jgi:glutathione S-transferase
MHELTGIAFSHYVEKARWALDRFGVAYSEQRLLPIYHFAAVYRLHRGKLGRADRASTRFSTPILRTDDGRLLCDSADILAYVSARFAPVGLGLYAQPEAATFERRYHDELGPESRLIAYATMFSRPELLHRLARHNVDAWQSGSLRVVYPLLRPAVERLLGLEPRRVALAYERVRSVFEATSLQLRDDRPYLLGDRFSAADIAFACLAAPVLLPAEYSAWLPPLTDLPAQMQDLVATLRDTPAGKFALRMFAMERRRVLRPNPETPAVVLSAGAQP